MASIIRRELDFFTVEAELDNYHVDFTIYEGIGHLEKFEEQLKLGIDPSLGPNYDSNPLVKGYVKWDGCSNWDFPTKPGTTHPLHFCSYQEAKCFGELFPKLYEWSAELMPNNQDMILDE